MFSFTFSLQILLRKNLQCILNKQNLFDQIYVFTTCATNNCVSLCALNEYRAFEAHEKSQCGQSDDSFAVCQCRKISKTKSTRTIRTRKKRWSCGVLFSVRWRGQIRLHCYRKRKFRQRFPEMVIHLDFLRKFFSHSEGNRLRGRFVRSRCCCYAIVQLINSNNITPLFSDSNSTASNVRPWTAYHAHHCIPLSMA